MPRNITVTFADGSTHVYQGAPDNVTPDQVSARAAKEFGKPVKALDGGRGAAPAKAGPKQYNGLAPDKALATYNQARDSLLKNMAGKSEFERKRALTRFDTDPRIQGIRQAAGLAEVRSRQEEIKDVGRRSVKTGAAGNFGTALKAGITRGLFGIPERLAATGLYYGGDSGDLNYDETLSAVRAKTDEELSRSFGGNILGQLVGGVASGRGAGQLIGGAGRKLAATGAPVVQKVGNVLQGLTQVKKGERLKNVGKVVLAGGAGGGAQALGEGSDVMEGVAYGAAAPVVLGGAVKIGGAVGKVIRQGTRPFSKNVSKALREIVGENPDAIEARRVALSNQVGGEVPIVAALKDGDFRKVADEAVSRSDEAVEIAKGQTGKYVRSFMDRMLKHVNKAGREANDGGAQITSIGELAELRKNTADDLMQPIADRTMDLTQLSLDDLERKMTQEIGGRIRDLAPRVNEALKDIAPDDLKAMGLDASDLAAARKLMSAWGMGKPVPVTVREMDALRRSLDAASRATANGNPANSMAYRNAARSIREFVENEVPEYGQMVDTYAAQSRMMEGFETAAAGRRVGDIEDDLLRNNLKTPEGRIGLKAGELYRQRQAVSARPTSAIAAARDYAARGNLTRPASMEPDAALPGTVTENLGDASAANLANAAEGETAVLDRMLDTNKIDAKADTELGSISPEQIAYGAMLGGSMAITKARFAVNVLKSLVGVGRSPISKKVAENIAEMLYSQDPAQIQKAMNALNKVGLTERAVTKLMQEAVPASAAAGAIAGGEGAPDGLPMEDVPSVEADLMGMGQGEPVAEGDMAAGDSPYAGQLQEILANESPELVDLIQRQAMQESGGRQFDENGNPITSSAGAVGIMQVMPDTAPEAARLAGLPWDENAYRTDENYNMLLGIAYMSEMLDRYDGDVEKALAAYNAGPGRLDEALVSNSENWLDNLPAETQNYVVSILS